MCGGADGYDDLTSYPPDLGGERTGDTARLDPCCTTGEAAGGSGGGKAVGIAILGEGCRGLRRLCYAVSMALRRHEKAHNVADGVGTLISKTLLPPDPLIQIRLQEADLL